MNRRLPIALLVVLLTSFTQVIRADLPQATTQPNDKKTPLRLTIERGFRCALESPGGKLPFPLTFKKLEGGSWFAEIQNGAELIRLDDVEISDDSMRIGFPHYDAEIVAKKKDGAYVGTWRKQAAIKKESSLPFKAKEGEAYRFRTAESLQKVPSDSHIVGRWRTVFSESNDPAIGVFSINSRGMVEGTFLTTTGDYRFLSGDFSEGRLRLSSFDGAHAFLFDASLIDDQTLKGDFWSRDAWHETWTATRDDDVALPDGFKLVEANHGVDLSGLAFPDVDGVRRTLDDEAWRGKPRIIEIFGTWCPNCHDAARDLNEHYARYKDRGLVVIGLAFELTGDFERDSRQVRRFQERHELEYPLLVGGNSDRARIAKRIKLIEELKAFPTTIFLDRSGRVTAVHTGYSGPATGEAHTKLRADFESVIDSILKPEGDQK